ncbi:MAG: hypothetical protein U5L00_15415 [Desulfovermiculus sp.]|nr:hypothetical protein [Desulfovermiculus sp.]
MTNCCDQTTIISQDVTYIDVGGTQAGIIGLPEAFAALKKSFPVAT